MGMIQFVNNYDDLSTDKGYQFKFHCDKCGNGYMSRYQPSLTGTGGSLLRAAACWTEVASALSLMPRPKRACRSSSGRRWR